jgi:hypothetical protein
MFRIKRKQKNNILEDLGPLYHKYSFFGVDNDQLPGIYDLNQKAKAPIITAYIAYAVAKSKVKASDTVSFTELFCADGYYSMVAERLGCNLSVGIDNDRDKHFSKASLIADRLGLKNVVFQKQEIVPSASLDERDIVANIGGLYHVENPEQILELSYRTANKYLIVQSVVSLATDDEDYYESPAPGWTWGNRFSRESFDKMIKKHKYQIVDQYFNELEGNDRQEDRGSVYYLIKK